MAGEVKIYDGEGNLKLIISSQVASKLHSDNLFEPVGPKYKKTRKKYLKPPINPDDVLKIP